MLLTQSNKDSIIAFIKTASAEFAIDPNKLFHTDGDHTITKNNLDEVDEVFYLYRNSMRVLEIFPGLFEDRDDVLLGVLVDSAFVSGAVKQSTLIANRFREIMAAQTENALDPNINHISLPLEGQDGSSLKIIITNIQGTQIRYAVLSDDAGNVIAKFTFADVSEWSIGSSSTIPTLLRYANDMAMEGKIFVDVF